MSISMTEEAMEYKVVRHVRTPAGERRFGQRIGSVIVRDVPLKNLIEIATDFPGWDMYRGNDGNKYYVGKHKRKWTATDHDDNVLVQGNSEEDVLEALDKIIKPRRGQIGVQVRQMTRADRRRLEATKKPEGGVPIVEIPKHYQKQRSNYEGFQKYKTDDGEVFYTSTENGYWISSDEDDQVIDDVDMEFETEEALLKHINTRIQQRIDFQAREEARARREQVHMGEPDWFQDLSKKRQVSFDSSANDNDRKRAFRKLLGGDSKVRIQVDGKTIDGVYLDDQNFWSNEPDKPYRVRIKENGKSRAAWYNASDIDKMYGDGERSLGELVGDLVQKEESDLDSSPLAGNFPTPDERPKNNGDWIEYDTPIPAAGQPPLQVGDVVRKGNGKTDWYVTSAEGEGDYLTYGLSQSPSGQRTGAAYSYRSLKIVKRKKASAVEVAKVPNTPETVPTTRERGHGVITDPNAPVEKMTVPRDLTKLKYEELIDLNKRANALQQTYRRSDPNSKKLGRDIARLNVEMSKREDAGESLPDEPEVTAAAEKRTNGLTAAHIVDRIITNANTSPSPWNNYLKNEEDVKQWLEKASLPELEELAKQLRKEAQRPGSGRVMKGRVAAQVRLRSLEEQIAAKRKMQDTIDTAASDLLSGRMPDARAVRSAVRRQDAARAAIRAGQSVGGGFKIGQHVWADGGNRQLREQGGIITGENGSNVIVTSGTRSWNVPKSVLRDKLPTETVAESAARAKQLTAGMTVTFTGADGKTYTGRIKQVRAGGRLIIDLGGGKRYRIGADKVSQVKEFAVMEMKIIPLEEWELFQAEVKRVLADEKPAETSAERAKRRSQARVAETARRQQAAQTPSKRVAKRPAKRVMKKRQRSEPKKQSNSKWDESKHPRNALGQFVSLQRGDGYKKDDPQTQDIKDIQAALVALGLLGAADGNNGNAVDGKFGPKTEAAVKKWQKDNGFEPDGMLTKEQLDALKNTKAKEPLADKPASDGIEEIPGAPRIDQGEVAQRAKDIAMQAERDAANKPAADKPADPKAPDKTLLSPKQKIALRLAATPEDAAAIVGQRGIDEGDISERQWDELLKAGWRGLATSDGREAIYPPGTTGQAPPRPEPRKY